VRNVGTLILRVPTARFQLKDCPKLSRRSSLAAPNPSNYRHAIPKRGRKRKVACALFDDLSVKVQGPMPLGAGRVLDA
jgi:hypothetical protein